MRPLRIRAWLRTAVVSDDALPLDGILLYQAMRREYGPRDATLPGTVPNVEMVPLPLERTNSAQWYYRCSFAQWPQVAHEKSAWTKRVATHRMAILDDAKSKVDIGSGRYRSYHMPVFARAALFVDWYAVGDQDAIADLLRDVWAIGKKTVQGWGRVALWQVEPWDEDWSVWQDDQLMRAIPPENAFDPTDLRLIGYRPPYWMQENQTLCIVPQ